MRAIPSYVFLTAMALLPVGLHAQAPVSGTPAANPSPATAAKPMAMDIAKKPPEMLLNMSIQDGVLSVDGMIAKVHLDYNLVDQEFFYFYVPGEGTAVASRFKTPNSTEVKDAFRGNVLAFSTGGHDFKLENSGPLVTRGSGSAYVKMDNDRNAKFLGNYPMMGYGMRPQAPYAWPAALPLSHTGTESGMKGPPLPAYMLPTRTSVSVSTVPAQAPANTR